MKCVILTFKASVLLLILIYRVGQKNCTPTLSQQIVLQCVPIKLVLSDLSAQAHTTLILLNFLLVEYSTQSLILMPS